MSPFQHGEVFVTDDGAETDLDWDTTSDSLTLIFRQANNWTTGRFYLFGDREGAAR